MEKEAGGRLDELVTTVGHLIKGGGGDRLPAIQQDLEKIEVLRCETAATARRGRP